MKASCKGHIDIVRILIDAKVQVNTQEEVCCNLYTAQLGERDQAHSVI